MSARTADGTSRVSRPPSSTASGTPVAASWAHPFAGTENVKQPAGHWTDSISHGELIRAGTDETLEVDPADVRFLYQGVSDADREGKPYGQIPWRLAILRPAKK